MARLRGRRGSLADILDLSDLNGAVEAVIAMTEEEFTRAVLLYLEGDRVGMDVMRDPDVIERTYDTIDRLLHSARRRWRAGEDTARLIESLDVERKVIREEAIEARRARIREQQAERDVAYAEGVGARLEQAVAKQRAAREALEQVQRKGLDARALERLKKNHMAEFLAIRRALKEQDDAAAAAEVEQTREDGAGAADPPQRSTTPAGALPLQAARV